MSFFLRDNFTKRANANPRIYRPLIVTAERGKMLEKITKENNNSPPPMCVIHYRQTGSLSVGEELCSNSLVFFERVKKIVSKGESEDIT